MLILGIESSCDDTSVALLDCSEQGCFVIKESTASQIEIHQKYGGVVPEIAGRMHAEKIVPLIEQVLTGQSKPDIIAVTTGPGLITGLIVGTEAARTLAWTKNIPTVSVNHISGHIHAVEIGEYKIQYPALALIVSGGHTELIYITEPGDYKILGATLDDAAGECFDKVAKLLGLPYPGGPQISKLAETGNTKTISFPRPMLDSDNLNFSFSGLKTSALYWLRDNKLTAEKIIPYELPTGIYGQSNSEPTTNDFCASFEQAIVDVLVKKTIKAAEEYKLKTIILGGGVAANKKLREELSGAIKQFIPYSLFLVPSLKYCMDNAAMIAVAGYKQAIKKDFTDWQNLTADPNWELGR
ncbi:MAG: putative tRNA threonylcarbamoyladenosine biosynthesis protein Gcp [Candidatus Magasanikbacteria bacterium GW2011_GWA2_37_8]|uniref:tRNA N6-adenosine threonylcarbamoyltransferase n=1 Tax=Candidatus Magasanikbacteria bacterium GW2011_GWA2_37_8 TaxID=1619036 RepID=A0A0G0HC91_9BACT|nr:MAG: putative tRNA threonylcarbamoyladenosine biosynthesis protein Gcp [Candidatus Magasanikbacteria bacterium GW2011_GWA2_37_8]